MMTNTYSKIQLRVTEEYRFARIETMEEYESLAPVPPPFNLLGYFYSFVSWSAGRNGDSSAGARKAFNAFNFTRLVTQTPWLKQRLGGRRRGSSLIREGASAVRSFAVQYTQKTHMNYTPIKERADTEQAATLERDLLLEYLKELRERRQKIESSEVTIQVTRPQGCAPIPLE